MNTEERTAILDSNGYFEKLWQFSAMLVQRGFKIIAVDRDNEFAYGSLPKADYDAEHILLRACDTGKPTVTHSFIELRGHSYQPKR